MDELVTIGRLGASVGPLLAALLPPMAAVQPAPSQHTPNGTYEQILLSVFGQVLQQHSTSLLCDLKILVCSMQICDS